eukprot:TRINITY_DN4182_c0_g1_i1.p1 TRINITY_DN4182_c0_g1~~TRINITY_DN4182_c0_g1_i1.p1  ORF type:complete len:504 (-),score=128.94 TRINITY_DN4182_c0_g1_i1:53-1564(-)
MHHYQNISTTSEDDDDDDLSKVNVPKTSLEHGHWFSFRKLAAFLGPGFLMSIAYIDPGNLESDVQAGATSKFQLLWVLLWSTVIGLLLQLLSVKLGVVTGKNLAELCREKYRRPSRIALWIMMELAIIGSDIQEVVGSAIAINILTANRVPIWAGVMITAADTFTFLFLEKYGVRKLEAFFGALILVMAVSFGVEYGISKPDQAEVIKGIVVPRLDNANLVPAMGLVGAIIMPHNLYLHSALVQSRRPKTHNNRELVIINRYYAIESAIALLISFIINVFVVSVFASGFYGAPNADSMGVQQAGQLISAKYGKFAEYIWAIGLLAAGQSSTMTGTYSGQVVMQGFLSLQIKPWQRLMVTRVVAIVPAIIVALAANSKLDALDEWLNVLQSLQLPFAILPLLFLCCDMRTMGSYFMTKGPTKIFFCAVTAILLGINLYFVVAFVVQQKEEYLYIISSLLGFPYLLFVGFLMYDIGVTFTSRNNEAQLVVNYGTNSYRSMSTNND